jgi:hypothetical protein
MRRATPITVLALAAAAPVAGSTVVAHSSATPAKPEVLKLYAPLLQSKLLDLSDAGFGLGDQSVFSDKLLTAPNGQDLGFDGGVCTVVRVDDAAAGSGILHCVVTMSLKGGTISTQGFTTVKNLALTGKEVAGITGGTGRFRSARGEALINFTGPGKANVTLTISK